MSACIEWPKSRYRNGYGQLMVNYRKWQAHRWVWTQEHGPIPEGMCVLHRCDNPPCVNIDHLFLGTHQDNVDDMIAKGRHGGPVKLTKDQVAAIRSDQRLQRIIAAEYGVTQGHVSEIKRGLVWA
jgi:hypothetical protein